MEEKLKETNNELNEVSKKLEEIHSKYKVAKENLQKISIENSLLKENKKMSESVDLIEKLKKLEEDNRYFKEMTWLYQVISFSLFAYVLFSSFKY